MQSIKNILKSNIKKMGLERRLTEKMIFTDWEKIAGDKVFKNSRPVFIRSGTLFMEVPDSVWAHSLTFLKPSLIAKINGYLKAPVVKDIRLRCGMVTKRRITEMPKVEEKKLTDYELNRIKDMFIDLKLDLHLKNTLERIVRLQKLYKNKSE